MAEGIIDASKRKNIEKAASQMIFSVNNALLFSMKSGNINGMRNAVITIKNLIAQIEESIE
jgi:hypothetical protein